MAIGYTVEQAAARVYRSEATIRRWIRVGRLPSILGVDGRRYVWEDDLIEAEHESRTTQRATRFSSPQVSAACAIVESRSAICA